MTTRKKFVPRPDVVSVGHMAFLIEYLTEDEWANANENPDHGGATRHMCGSIRIRLTPNIDEQCIRETLLHEIMHCVWSTTMLNQNHRHFPESEREEEIVAMQSPMMLQVIQANPGVFAYLADTEQH